MFEQEGFGSVLLNSWLKEMQKNKMLRLFGIAENDLVTCLSQNMLKKITNKLTFFKEQLLNYRCNLNSMI